MFAAVILRQCEEMEDDENETSPLILDSMATQIQQRVNFLPIVHAILESTCESLSDSTLANTVFWMAARQDLFHAMFRGEDLYIMDFDARKRSEASAANSAVVFAVDVVRWWRGDRSAETWGKSSSSSSSSTLSLYVFTKNRSNSSTYATRTVCS